MSYQVEGVCSKYIQTIREIPMLSEDEEFILAKQWRDKQDKRSLDRLIKSHLKLVVSIAHGYKGYGLPMDDLIAEGQVGIMQASKHFDPEKGFKFATYAQWWIKSLIQEYVLHSWSLVKIGTTNAQKKLFFSLRKVKNKLDKESENTHLTESKIFEIAQHLKVTPEEVVQMHQRLLAHDNSLNTPLKGDTDSESEWIEWISDSQDSQEKVVLEENEKKKQTDVFNTAFAHLSPREQRIMTQRRLIEEPKTLEELSIELDISKERVRQIEAESLEKIKKHIKRICQSSKIHF